MKQKKQSIEVGSKWKFGAYVTCKANKYLQSQFHIVKKKSVH